jgi:hypothetical protein
LLSPVEPLQGFVQNRRHLVLPPMSLPDRSCPLFYLGMCGPQTRSAQRRLLTILHEQSHRVNLKKSLTFSRKNRTSALSVRTGADRGDIGPAPFLPWCSGGTRARLEVAVERTRYRSRAAEFPFRP